MVMKRLKTHIIFPYLCKSTISVWKENYFTFMAAMQDLLPIQVEVIELEESRFAEKFIENGIKVICHERTNCWDSGTYSAMHIITILIRKGLNNLEPK